MRGIITLSATSWNKSETITHSVKNGTVEKLILALILILFKKKKKKKKKEITVVANALNLYRSIIS
jgi:hypothetical protein